MRRWFAAAVILVVALIAVSSRAGSGGTSPSTGGQRSTSRRSGRIAFIRTSPDGSAAVLVRTNPDGSHNQTVPPPSRPETFSSPAWSPDGATLLISHTYRLDTSGQCCLPFRPATVKPDGSRFTQYRMRYAPPGIDCPVWSADATRILCGFGGSHPGVYSVRAADGGDPIRLSTNPFGSEAEEAIDQPTSVSPDGTRFLFIRYRPGKRGDREANKMTALFVENLDGTGLRQITPYGLTAAHEDAWAAWSPDGHEILSVASGRAGHPGPITCFDAIGACLATQSHLFVIHPDGSGFHTITLHGSAATRGYRVLQPSWSPDGSKIIFCLWPDAGAEDVYTANADGSDPAQVTHDADFENAPRWR